MESVESTIDQAKTQLRQARSELYKALQTEHSVRRGRLMKRLYRTEKMLGMADHYYSESGQDRVIDSLLKGKRAGVFADIGGYDGVQGSNTLFFEVFRGWTGILVEPSPAQMKVAKLIRRCVSLPYAIAGEEGEAEFMEVVEGLTQMSGLLDSYDPETLERVRSRPRHKEIIHKLQKRNLNSVLAEQGMFQIDFLSLDVEGGEMSILENFDFGTFDVQYWSIENDPFGSEIPMLMKSNGYELLELVGVDCLFGKAEQPSSV